MEKEYIYIRKDIADKLKDMNDAQLEKEDIMKIIKEFNTEIETYTYDIDESVVNFRRQAKKIRDGFKEVVDEEVKALYEFWETQEKRRKEIQRKLSETIDKFATVKNEIINVEKMINKIHIYGLKDFIELVEKIQNMKENDKELLAKMFAYCKSE